MKGIGFLLLALVVALGVMGVGAAHWADSLTISATVTTGMWEVGGSPGFWKNWDKHDTYTEHDIEEFLDDIRGASAWLDDVEDIGDMEAVLEAGDGGTKEERFLSQYLATRLNAEAERLYLGTSHDFSDYDSGNYLGLGGEGTLEEIIDAIESKYDGPTDGQFETMKDICEALNKVDT